jgi:glycosyltransferase involved in cell wall biosynthesis
LEIIVVDSNSSDTTAAIARSHGASVYFEKGLARQRFKGIATSSGKYILLLDSDQIVSPNLIKKCVSTLESRLDLDALIIPETPIATGSSIGLTQSSYLMHSQRNPHVLYGTSLPRFFRGTLLRSIKPPRHELGYFDHAWVYRSAVNLGARITFVDETIQHLEFNTTLTLAKKFYRYYGHYIVPALLEDWKLVIGKSLPKRSVTNSSTAGESIRLLMLFGLKAISTCAGVIGSIARRKRESGPSDSCQRRVIISDVSRMKTGS